MKFLRFWSKEKTFNFCGFFFPRIVNFGNEKKKCLYYRKQQVKRCYDKQLVHITVILRSKHIFSSREIFKRYNFWIRICYLLITPLFLLSSDLRAELEVKETTDTASSASFLDLYLEFDHITMFVNLVFIKFFFRHLKIHDGTKLFCPSCTQYFDSEEKLNKHKIDKHSYMVNSVLKFMISGTTSILKS